MEKSKFFIFFLLPAVFIYAQRNTLLNKNGEQRKSTNKMVSNEEITEIREIISESHVKNRQNIVKNENLRQVNKIERNTNKEAKVENEIFLSEGFEAYPQNVFEQGECIADITQKLSLQDVYPNFPLRFLNGNINYTFSYYDEYLNIIDVYALEFNIKLRQDNYFDLFGIRINFNDTNQLEIFNEEEELFTSDSIYLFSKDIEIFHTGYVNLRIGYFDKLEEIFYPEKLLEGKTDLLIYIKPPIQRNFIEN